MAAARKTKDWLNSPAAEDAADVSAAVSTIDPGSTPPSDQESEVASSTEPDWSAELSRACRAANTALQELDEWHQRVGKLTGQLAAAKAEQQVALADHTSDSEARVQRIANAQIREKVIAADLEHESVLRTKLVNAVRDAAKRLGQPVAVVYLRERERRVAAVLAELRATLDPGIVHGLESIEEPGHTMSDHMRQWPTMLEYAAALHSRVRKLASVAVSLPNFDSYGQIVSDEELGYLIGSATGFLAAIAKLQAEIDGYNPSQNTNHFRRKAPKCRLPHRQRVPAGQC